MTDKFALLHDLAGLVRKHGPDTFSDLVRFLRDPDAVEELVRILEAAETAGRRARVGGPRTVKTHGKAPTGGTRKLLSQLGSAEPEKAQMLSGLYEALLAKQALPTLADIRRFAKDNGLPDVTVTAREKAISSLLRNLSSRPTDDIRSILRRVRVAVTGGDRSLEGWTGVILGKDRSRGGS